MAMTIISRPVCPSRNELTSAGRLYLRGTSSRRSTVSVPCSANPAPPAQAPGPNQDAGTSQRSCCWIRAPFGC